MAAHPVFAHGIRRGALLLLGGVVAGAAFGVACGLVFHVVIAIGPERLSMERHLWNVATETEQEQIREILFRSYADPALICELTAKRPPLRLLDLPVRPPVVPAPLPPPEPPPKPAHPFADTP